MASNGLLADLSKTEIMLLNNKVTKKPRKIRVAKAEIQEVKSPKLLGKTMNLDQNWTGHIGETKDCSHH